MGEAFLSQKNSSYTTIRFDDYSNITSVMLHKNSKYKFQNMSSEATVTSDIAKITLPTPVTGYIKVKNVTLS